MTFRLPNRHPDLIIPGRPVPWKRTRGGRRSHPDYARYKRFIRDLARFKGVKHYGADPVGIAALVVLPDARQGDHDNYLKALSDALEGVCYDNDRQITESMVRKRIDRDGEGRMAVWLWSAGGAHDPA